jgi:molybdate transport system ATP-binding protein
VADLVAELAIARGELAIRIDLRCPPGITCLMGPSGSGKSSILAALAGLLPAEGRIAIGETVWLDRKHRVDVAVHERSLAYVFQGLALFPHMTALHNVTYGMHHVERVARAGKARALLDQLGVGHLAGRRPRTFSGGEAQRVALARALGRAPHLVLLDEPFSALDRDLRAQLCRLVRDLVGELGVPAVHVTHSVAEARQLADRVILIERGTVIATGTPAEVLAERVELE